MKNVHVKRDTKLENLIKIQKYLLLQEQTKLGLIKINEWHLIFPNCSLELELIGRSNITLFTLRCRRAYRLSFFLRSYFKLHLKISMISEAIAKANSRISSCEWAYLINKFMSACDCVKRVQIFGKFYMVPSKNFMSCCAVVVVVVFLSAVLCQFNPRADTHTHLAHWEPFNHHLSYILCGSYINMVRGYMLSEWERKVNNTHFMLASGLCS